MLHFKNHNHESWSQGLKQWVAKFVVSGGRERGRLRLGSCCFWLTSFSSHTPLLQQSAADYNFASTFRSSWQFLTSLTLSVPKAEEARVLTLLLLHETKRHEVYLLFIQNPIKAGGESLFGTFSIFFLSALDLLKSQGSDICAAQCTRLPYYLCGGAEIHVYY